MRMQFSFRSSCSNKHRSPRSFLIITSGCADFPISPVWRALPKMRCFKCGKASAITLAREICTPQQKRLSINTVETSQGKSSGCGVFPESANILLMLWQALPLINRFRLSKPTPVASWRGSSICANQSIPVRAGRSFGNMQQVFFRNLTPRFSTPHFSILARSFACLENRNATCAR